MVVLLIAYRNVTTCRTRSSAFPCLDTKYYVGWSISTYEYSYMHLSSATIVQLVIKGKNSGEESIKLTAKQSIQNMWQYSRRKSHRLWSQVPSRTRQPPEIPNLNPTMTMIQGNASTHISTWHCMLFIYLNFIHQDLILLWVRKRRRRRKRSQSRLRKRLFLLAWENQLEAPPQ